MPRPWENPKKKIALRMLEIDNPTHWLGFRVMKLTSHQAVITRTMGNLTCLSRENLPGSVVVQGEQALPLEHACLQIRIADSCTS